MSDRQNHTLGSVWLVFSWFSRGSTTAMLHRCPNCQQRTAQATFELPCRSRPPARTSWYYGRQTCKSPVTLINGQLHQSAVTLHVQAALVRVGPTTRLLKRIKNVDTVLTVILLPEQVSPSSYWQVTAVKNHERSNRRWLDKCRFIPRLLKLSSRFERNWEYSWSKMTEMTTNRDEKIIFSRRNPYFYSFTKAIATCPNSSKCQAVCCYSAWIVMRVCVMRNFIVLYALITYFQIPNLQQSSIAATSLNCDNFAFRISTFAAKVLW